MIQDPIVKRDENTGEYRFDLSRNFSSDARATFNEIVSLRDSLTKAINSFMENEYKEMLENEKI